MGGIFLLRRESPSFLMEREKMETEKKENVVLRVSKEYWGELLKAMNERVKSLRENFLCLLNLYNCEVGAEVGVLEGEHAIQIIEYLPNLKKLYLVDSWKAYSADEYPDFAATNQEGNDNRYQQVIQKFSTDTRIIIIRKESVQASLDINEPLDFVYIDANHRYEFVASDILVWYQKVKSGGLVCGHDYDKPEVARAVDDFCSAMGIINHSWGAPLNLSWFFVKK